MPAYTTDRETGAFMSSDVYVLGDSNMQSSVRLVPARGNNLLSFRVHLGGHDIETILPPPSGVDSPRAFVFGNAILFPFPNRIRNARFHWEGREYQFDPNWRGHHIHGLIAEAPWRVVEAVADDAGARLTCELRSEDNPEVIRQFPFPFTLTTTYALKGNTLTLDVVARNIGPTSMPMGFGIHPYFRMPLLPGGSRSACEVRIPSARQWELDEDLITTGRIVDVSPERDFRRPRPIGETFLDDVFTDVEFDNGATTCLLYDPHAHAELAVSFGRKFREVVVYAPLDRETICFEPYTCPSNAINLEAAGIPANIVALQPGATWSARIWFSAREGRK